MLSRMIGVSWKPEPSDSTTSPSVSIGEKSMVSDEKKDSGYQCEKAANLPSHNDIALTIHCADKGPGSS